MLTKSIKLLISIVFLIFVFIRIDFHSVIQIIQNASTPFSLLALMISISAILINTEKWQIILSAAKIKIHYLYLLRYNLTSIIYGIILLGQISGEVIKAYQISKTGSQKKHIISSIIADKTSGLFALFCIGIITIPVTISHAPNLLAPIILLSLGGVIFVILSFSRKFLLFFNSLVQKISFSSKLSVGFNKFSALAESYQQYGGRKIFFQMMGISFLYQIFAATSFMFAAQAFGIILAPMEYIWMFTLVSILLFLPISVAGLGIREGSLIFFLSIFGISAEKAISVSLLLLVLNIIMGMIGIFLQLSQHQFRKKAPIDTLL